MGKSEQAVEFDVEKHVPLSKTERANLKALAGYDELEWFVEVVVLETGQSFGELALINDQPRASTVVCLSDCFFAVLEKSDYLRVLKRIENKHLMKKVEFFRHLPFL